MALQTVIKASGKTIDDLEMALKEALKRINEGYTSGCDKNEDGNFSFTVEGFDESEGS
ncbi:hypothetical protein ACI2KR_31465 [Pseudomonas luteola]